MRNVSAKLGVILLVATHLVGAAPPNEFFVSPPGSDEADGLTVETSLGSITEALERARALEGETTIWVLPGSYGPDSERFPLEPPPWTTIAGYDPAERPRIGGTFESPVFWVHDIPTDIPPYTPGEVTWPEEDPHAAVLKDLVIRDGGRCSGGVGGGLRVTRATVMIVDCDIVENHTSLRGAGIAAEEESKIIVRSSRVHGNYRCGSFSQSGTAVFLRDRSIGAFEDCEFTKNDGHAIERITAGLDLDYEVRAILRRCEILDNFGTPLRSHASSVTVEGSIISGNWSFGFAPLDLTDGHLVLRNSLVYGNMGATSSGILLSTASALIDGCVVAYNNSQGPLPAGGEGLYAENFPPELDLGVTITNSIFWENNTIAEKWRQLRFPPPKLPSVRFRQGELRYSIAQESTPPFDDWGIGGRRRHVEVLEVDPQFVDPLAGDFRLREGSPGIDAGDPESPADADGTRRDIGISFPELEPHYIFLRGDPNGDGLTDISDAVRILRGLFRDATLLSCADAADFDDNGAVEITDAIVTLIHLFAGGPFHEPRPPPPNKGWGVDWTEDDLECVWR